MMNSRPLSPVSSDPNDFSVLTAGHFLTMEPLTILPESNLVDAKLGPLQRWKLLQKIHQDFWRLLALTGLLWGCTNPFIRRGTRGLRDVHARTWHAQAWAELCFLLGNWRYVVPWLVNQLGSLAYLVAVRRAPLSLVVPAANGLAFAATAATGAAVGDHPLDRGSILGIVLIVAGTALCCWDQVD